MAGVLVGVNIGEINKNGQKLGGWRGLGVWQNRDLGERRGDFWNQCWVIFDECQVGYVWKGYW